MNANRIVKELSDANVSDQKMAGDLRSKLNQINPYRLWLAVSYDDIAGGDKHWMITLDALHLLHYRDKYNILITSLPKKSTYRPSEARVKDIEKSAS